MQEERKEIVKWLVNSQENVVYDEATFYRCVGIQDFIEKVEKENEIVGVTFSGNNLGFILSPKNK